MAHRSPLVRKALLVIQLAVVVGTVAVPAFLGAAMIVWGMGGHAESLRFLLPGAVLVLWAGIMLPNMIFAYRAGVREGRHELSLCLSCGCDLRGSKERCPECGVEVFTPPTHWPPAFRVRLVIGLFPELLRFETAEQERVFARAAKNWRTNVCFAVLAIPAGFLCISVLPSAIACLNLWPIVAGPLNMCVTVALLMSLIHLVFAFTRRTIHGRLHRRLIEMGVSICLGCGYDLQGSKERCPECGKEFGSSREGS